MFPHIMSKHSNCERPGNIIIYGILFYCHIKGQCVGIKIMQSCIISQLLKSLLNVILQKFMELKINNGKELRKVKHEHPSKYSEG